MSKASSITQDASGTPGRTRVSLEQAALVREAPEILNDEVLIDIAPDRPCGTIRVKLVHAGRSSPIPAENPWAE